MDREKVKEIALKAGFKLKEQEGRDPDLNDYVYAFAESVVECYLRTFSNGGCNHCEFDWCRADGEHCSSCRLEHTNFSSRDGS